MPSTKSCPSSHAGRPSHGVVESAAADQRARRQDIELRVALNVGHEPRALNRVASGSGYRACWRSDDPRSARPRSSAGVRRSRCRHRRTGGPGLATRYDASPAAISVRDLRACRRSRHGRIIPHRRQQGRERWRLAADVTVVTDDAQSPRSLECFGGDGGATSQAHARGCWPPRRRRVRRLAPDEHARGDLIAERLGRRRRSRSTSRGGWRETSYGAFGVALLMPIVEWEIESIACAVAEAAETRHPPACADDADDNAIRRCS